MKYLCLVYLEEHRRDSLPRDEYLALVNESIAYIEELKASQHYIAAEPLEPVNTAATVRVRNGAATVTDGPFAETKEQLGGFYMIDVPDLDAALSWAARCPGASRGIIEVRPVWPFE